MTLSSQARSLDACSALSAICPDGQVRCHLVTEYASDMISVHDLDDAATYLYASPAARRLFGYDAADLTGRSAFDFIHPRDRAEVAQYAARLRASPDIATVRYRLRRKTGGYEWVESTCRMVSDPVTGEPAEIVATTRYPSPTRSSRTPIDCKPIETP